MNLKAYTAQIGMKIKDFCQLVNCTPPFLSAVMHGKKFVSKDLQKKVYELTDGEVILPLRPHRKKRKTAGIPKNKIFYCNAAERVKEGNISEPKTIA